MGNEQISTSEESYGHLRGVTKLLEESYGHLRGVTKLLLRGVLKAQSQTGQSLIEVIVASAVGILVVTALTFATIFSLRNAQFAKNSAQATKLAQEGIERIRTGRDRNSGISITGVSTVDSWSSSSEPIWSYQISANGNCGYPSSGSCYFNVDITGALDNIGFQSASFPSSSAEGIPETDPIFKRAVILTDDSASYATQKKVTVIVQWTDFAGAHESRLTTILRKL